MTTIHPTAIVADDAGIGENVAIGPYSVIDADVEIGADCRIHSHVVITGKTRIGASCEIFPFASIGHIPQDLKFGGEASELVIGENNRIREHVTMNPGTRGGGGKTLVGSNGMFMVGAHVAHDCVIGDHVIMANNATLAGHCVIGDHAILGGLSAVHQFVRIGENAFVGGMSGVENDVIPYGMAIGNRAHLSGLNIIGMKRRNIDRESIHALRKAYRLLFSTEGTLVERVEDVEKMFHDDEGIQQVLSFIREKSDRSLCVPSADG